MPITFNSAGGFLNGTISSSNGDIFITTSGSVGAINIGNQTLTGSQVIEKDTSGNVRFKKTFNDDGTEIQEKFDVAGKTIETKVKDPTTGKEFIRSGSATSNQIEFKQDTTSAEITLSGSGINKLTFFGTLPSSDSTTHPGFFQRQDTPKGTVYSQNSGSVKVVSTGINAAGDYFISPVSVAPINSLDFNSTFKLTNEGDVSMSGDLRVTGKVLSSDEIILDDNGGDTLVRAYASGDDGIIDVYQNNAVMTRIAGNGVSYFGDNQGVAIGQTTNPAGSGGLTVNGEISASSTITSKTGFVGQTQTTGSYDFPGAIMGYNVDGHNSAHNSVSLTTSFAVPDDRLHVCFVAPTSGIVEIEAQVRLNMGSSTGAFFYLGLSDAATYNSLAAYYEQLVCDPDENDDVAITHKWVVPSLTPGTTYKYWLGAKVSSTSGTPTIVWGGSQSLRFSDFMMKATALPSNTDIQ